MPYLTKSDFKTARSCPTKLFYKKKRYSSNMDENPYLSFLADGGYVVETMAKLLYPEGREMTNWSDPVGGYNEAVALLKEHEECVLFEPTILNQNRQVRVDILQKVGTRLNLIEVKSSSVDYSDPSVNPFRNKSGGILSKWKEYLEDVTYQYTVISDAFPEYEVVPYLCVVDKSAQASEQTLFQQFTLKKCADAWAPEVEFLGDVEELRKNHLLAIIETSDEVAELEGEVRVYTDFLMSSFSESGIQKLPPKLTKTCKGCEYRLKDEGSGFNECWGELADSTPHILDFYKVGLVGGRSVDIVESLVKDGSASSLDIPERYLESEKPTQTHQRRIQECLKKNQVFLDPELHLELSHHHYPLHFIDFEGCRLALPYHEGMTPYGQNSFQWSCHTVHEDGRITHSEWLNEENTYPDFQFAKSLYEAISGQGTVYIWSKYERTALKEIVRAMEEREYEDSKVRMWMEDFINNDDEAVVDLLDLCRAHFYHPKMGGSYSIKSVLPVAWEGCSEYHTHEMFSQYFMKNEQGGILSPYDALPALEIAGSVVNIREGTGAVRGYQEMVFGLASQEADQKAQYRDLMLEYCKLDTAAMVIIWRYWLSLQNEGR